LEHLLIRFNRKVIKQFRESFKYTLSAGVASICPVGDNFGFVLATTALLAASAWKEVPVESGHFEFLTVLFDTLRISAFTYNLGCPMKEGSMSNTATYSWQQTYLAAVLETDNDLMPLRIYEALAAIEQRLLSPMDAIEQKIVDDAQTGLLTLKAERIAEGKHVIHEGQLSKETC
jgi:hypothetical protein